MILHILSGVVQECTHFLAILAVLFHRQKMPLAHGEEMQSGNFIDTRNPDVMLQSIVESGIDQVPPDFIKPLHERVSRERGASHEQIPVIDFALMDGAGKKQVLAEMAQACEDWGCFHVINHGMPTAVMDAAMAATKGLFALPAAERERLRMTKLGGAGYGRIYNRPGVAKDWNDRLFLTDFMETKPDRRAFFDLVLTNPPGAQEVLESYGEAVHKLGQRTMAALSEALGQAPEFLSRTIPAYNGTILNIYPPCPQPDLVMALAPHDDAGLFTFLQQGDVLGLEVLKDGRWIPVPPVPHAFVLIIADVMQVTSNDRFKSVTHRAVAGPVARTVIANFAMPNSNDAIIKPAPELCSDLKPPAFRSDTTFADYLKMVVLQDLHAKRVEVLRLAQ